MKKNELRVLLEEAIRTVMPFNEGQDELDGDCFWLLSGALARVLEDAGDRLTDTAEDEEGGSAVITG